MTFCTRGIAHKGFHASTCGYPGFADALNARRPWLVSWLTLFQRLHAAFAKPGRMSVNGAFALTGGFYYLRHGHSAAAFAEADAPRRSSLGRRAASSACLRAAVSVSVRVNARVLIPLFYSGQV